MKCHHYKLLLLVWTAFIVLMDPQNSFSAESLSIISPEKDHFAGRPILFHVQTKSFVNPFQASLFYRPAGFPFYKKISMKQETSVDFRALLKAQKVMPPGVEFFFVIEDGKGQTFTFPEINPKQEPYSLKVSLDKQPPTVLTLSPAEGTTVKESRPTISIKLEDRETGVNKKSVRLLVDGLDVSGLSEITDNKITYTPTEGLSDGRHTIVLNTADISGNRMVPKEWEIVIAKPAGPPQKAGFEKITAAVQWDAELQQGLVQKKHSTQPQWKLHSTAAIKAAAESEKTKISLAANLWYNDQEKSDLTGQDNFNLNNFLFQIEHQKQLLALGDVTVEGTELISKSIARRGGKITLDALGLKAQIFSLSSAQVTGFENILGEMDSNKRLFGADLEKDLFANKMLIMKVAYLEGKNYAPDNYNAGTLAADTAGDLFSLSVISLHDDEKIRFEGEYCASRFDSDVSDDQGKKLGKAWYGKIIGRVDRYNWETGYKYIGPEFKSIVNATGLGDREEYNINGGVRFSSSNLNLVLTSNRDNVENDPLMPVLRNTIGTISYSINKSNWPSLALNYTENLQASQKEPANFNPIKNQGRTIGSSISLAKTRWNLSQNYTFTTMNDRSPLTDNDSNTHVVALSGSLRPKNNLSFTPTFSYTNLKLEVNDLMTETWQGALSGVISIRENELNLNTTLSLLDNKVDDGSNHTTAYSSIFQINWDMKKYLKKHLETYHLENGRQSLSLRGQYTNTRNHVTDDDQEDFSLYLVIGFGMPINML